MKIRKFRPYRPQTKRSYTPISKNTKEIEAAGAAISGEKLRKRMLPASAYPCVICHVQAQDYHHPSYRREDRLCVVPLCTKCHIRAHRSNLALPPLGVVPTSVGLIRIAIATL